MATGIPCVTTDAAAMAEVITDGETGRLVPPDDAVALSAALLDVKRQYHRFDPAVIRQRCIALASEEVVLGQLEACYALL